MFSKRLLDFGIHEFACLTTINTLWSQRVSSKYHITCLFEDCKQSLIWRPTWLNANWNYSPTLETNIPTWPTSQPEMGSFPHSGEDKTCLKPPPRFWLENFNPKFRCKTNKTTRRHRVNCLEMVVNRLWDLRETSSYFSCSHFQANQFGSVQIMSS